MACKSLSFCGKIPCSLGLVGHGRSLFRVLAHMDHLGTIMLSHCSYRGFVVVRAFGRRGFRYTRLGKIINIQKKGSVFDALTDVHGFCFWP